MSIGLMTEIEAVNAIISVAGDAPVTSLSGDYEQAEIARRILSKISRDEQTKGLWFNEVNDLLISQNINGEINLPASTISAEAQGDNGELVQRGLRMFNRASNTYTINADVYINLIELLEWELLPQSFRAYVVAKSKEEYNNEYFGSQEVARTVERAIAETYIVMRTEDLKSKDINILNNVRSRNIAFSNRRLGR